MRNARDFDLVYNLSSNSTHSLNPGALIPGDRVSDTDDKGTQQLPLSDVGSGRKHEHVDREQQKEKAWEPSRPGFHSRLPLWPCTTGSIK